MVKDKRDDSRKLLAIGLAIVALLVFLLVAFVFLAGSNGGISVLGDHQLKLKPVGNGSVSDSRLSLIKGILQSRFHDQGYAASVNTMRDDRGNAFVLVNYSTVPYHDMVYTATTPGIFEMRIQTTGNQSEHVLFGDDIKNVGKPATIAISEGSSAWCVPFGLTDAGARKFQQACIGSGATNDPNSHNILMLLDGHTFFSQPLSPDMARSIATNPYDIMIATTGTGDAGKSMADQVYMCLHEGSLPIGMEVVSAGNETVIG